MNNKTPIIQTGQGDYAEPWPEGSSALSAPGTVRETAERVLERCQRGLPVSDRDAQTLAEAILRESSHSNNRDPLARLGQGEPQRAPGDHRD